MFGQAVDAARVEHKIHLISAGNPAVIEGGTSDWAGGVKLYFAITKYLTPCYFVYTI